MLSLLMITMMGSYTRKFPVEDFVGSNKKVLDMSILIIKFME